MHSSRMRTAHSPTRMGVSLDRDPLGQKGLLDRDSPLTQIPWTETPLDREPPRHRPPRHRHRPP